MYLTQAQREIVGQYRPGEIPLVETQTIRGTRISGGRLWKDPNPDLRRLHERLEVYDDIQTSDAVVAGAMSLQEESARTARFSLEKANDSVTAGRIKDFLHWALLERGQGQMKRPFAAAVRPLLSFAPLGFAYAEAVPRIVTIESGRYAGQRRVVLGDLAFCEQLAHDQWVIDGAGDLIGITQRPIGGDERWTPPASSTAFGEGRAGAKVVSVDRLVLLTHRGSAHNYDGIGQLRPTVFPWRAGNAAMDSGVIAITRFGSPTPVLEIDRLAMRERGYTETQINAMITEGVENMRNYIAQQSGYLQSAPGLTYGVFGNGAIDSRHVVEFVALCDRMKLLALVAQWILLGTSDVGSKASIIQHRGAHARVVANIVSQLCAALQPLLQRIVAWNFGERIAAEHTPTLKHHDVDAARLGEAMGMIPGLVQSGVLKATPALEEAVLGELVGVESAGPLVAAANALPESARGAIGGGGVFKPGPGRPEGSTSE